MRFLIDLDEVIYIGDIIAAVSSNMLMNEEIDKIYTGSDVACLGLDGLPCKLKDRVLDIFAHDKGVKFKQPLEGVYGVLHTIQSKGHEIAIATARTKNLEKVTIDKLDKDFEGIKFSNIFFCNTGKGYDHNTIDKGCIIKQWNANYFFDDNPNYCKQAEELIKTGQDLKAYLISNKHTGWNKSFNSNYVTKIKSLLHFDLRII